jgi:TRAP-type mannitol/chloroaromatic compound transport system substrate-binding protein
MPPFACFDAASQGTIEAFMAAPFYWAARDPAIQWFHTVPFGMNPEGMAAWLYQADGLKLMEEAYGAFNLVPRPGMAQGPQMAGWFRKKITTIGDYKGLRMRVGPFGGKVYVKAGSREESEKSPMARKVHASFTKFQAQLAGWARISEGAYHQLVAL